MIVVTAANGNQGRLLVPKLLAAGMPVRACVATDTSAARLTSLGVAEVVVGDLSDPDALADALRGAEKVFHVGPTLHPREREMGVGVVDAACREGVEHVVFSSVLHSIATGLVQHEIKRDVEEHLVASGLEFTILQPANFMLPLKLRPVFERGVFELSWSLERRQSMVDLEDVTDVALTVLTDSKAHTGATYELVGPGRYTAHDLGEIIGRVLGRPVEVRRIDADDYLRAWVGGGDPADFPHQLQVLRSITGHYSSHDFIGNPNVLTWLLGRPPTTFEEFVRRHRDLRSAEAPR